MFCNYAPFPCIGSVLLRDVQWRHQLMLSAHTEDDGNSSAGSPLPVALGGSGAGVAVAGSAGSASKYNFLSLCNKMMLGITIKEQQMLNLNEHTLCADIVRWRCVMTCYHHAWRLPHFVTPHMHMVTLHNHITQCILNAFGASFSLGRASTKAQPPTSAGWGTGWHERRRLRIRRIRRHTQPRCAYVIVGQWSGQPVDVASRVHKLNTWDIPRWNFFCLTMDLSRIFRQHNWRSVVTSVNFESTLSQAFSMDVCLLLLMWHGT